jgi:hypothetical protein
MATHTHTHTQNMLFLLLFHGKNYFSNAPQCYVTHRRTVINDEVRRRCNENPQPQNQPLIREPT